MIQGVWGWKGFMFWERAVPSLSQHLGVQCGWTGISWRSYTVLNGNKWKFENKPSQSWDFLAFYAHTRVGGCPIPGSVSGQVGWGSDGVNSTPAMGRWIWNEMIFNTPSNTNHSIIPRFCSKGEHELLNWDNPEINGNRTVLQSHGRGTWVDEHPFFFSIPVHPIMLLGLSFNHWEPAPDFGIRTK